MELLWNQQVDIFVMLFERGKAVGIPAHEKRGTHRIVARRGLSDVLDPAVTAFTNNWFLFRFDGAIPGFGVRQETSWQFHADGNGHEKIGEQHSEQHACSFHHAPGTAPAHTLRVIKYGTAFLHVTFQPGGTAGKYTSGWAESFCAIPSALLYDATH